MRKAESAWIVPEGHLNEILFRLRTEFTGTIYDYIYVDFEGGERTSRELCLSRVRKSNFIFKEFSVDANSIFFNMLSEICIWWYIEKRLLN